MARAALGKSPLKEVIREMTREEKVSLVLGTGMNVSTLPAELQAPAVGRSSWRVPGAAGETFAVPRLGIPALVLADGPAGVRIDPQRTSAPDRSFHATAFPIATALAASWDLDLAEEVGRATGAEVLGYGVDVLLAPALNLHRVPLGGRNFEYYSEDPLLSGSMAAAVVRGVQSNGVGASIKHFAANNHEWRREVMNVKVDERTLRELYLRGFEIAVREGKPWTLMTSYNRINGTFSSEDPRLLTTILREEWGFDGVVMTDWFGGRRAAAQMAAGNDLLMPGTATQHQILSKALDDGALDEAVLDRNIEHLLALIMKSPSFRATALPAVDLERGARVARAAAAQSMVLLENDRAVLPLARGARLALFGNGSYETVIGGTGSGDVNAAYAISFAQGLAAAGYRTDAAIETHHRAHLANEKVKQLPNAGAGAHMPVSLIDEPALDAELVARSADAADVALITLRRSSGEFADRSADDFSLSAAENALLEQVSRSFRAAQKPVVVVLDIGGPIETASWRERVDGILVAWQPGQEAGHALADVLSGAVNPSGKLPTTFPVRLDDVSAMQQFPGKLDEADDPDLLPPPWGGPKSAEIHYAEGLSVGYRDFQTRPAAVAFPFGHGLSYTTFEYGALHITPGPGAHRWSATLSVQNTGKVAGAEVVQLYVSAPARRMPKPSMELRRFGKTRVLEPGEAQTLTFELGLRELASFDVAASAWVAEAGEHALRASASATDIRQTAPLLLDQELRAPIY